jgi:hypothetical protein
MRKSIVLLTLAALTSAFAAGCMPAGEGPLAEFAPRPYSSPGYIMPDPALTQIDEMNAPWSSTKPKPAAQ